MADDKKTEEKKETKVEAKKKVRYARLINELMMQLCLLNKISINFCRKSVFSILPRFSR